MNHDSVLQLGALDIVRLHNLPQLAHKIVVYLLLVDLRFQRIEGCLKLTLCFRYFVLVIVAYLRQAGVLLLDLTGQLLELNVLVLLLL